MYSLEHLQQKNLKELKEIGEQLNVRLEGDRRCRQTWIDALLGVNLPLLQLLEVSPAVQEVESSAEVIAPAAENSPGVEVVPVQEPIIEMVETFPGVEVDRVQERIEDYLDIKDLCELDHADCPACGGIDSLDARWSQEYAYGWWIVFCYECDSTCIADELPPCLWGEDEDEDEDEDDDADSENPPGVEVDRAQEAIAPAAKISLDAESDQNPISTGITFSNRFLAHYSPPQTEIIHFQSDPDGQLSLLDFEVESEPEPPDPDDFETLEEFRKDLARWDWEHPSSFDYFSDLPSSVHCQEPNSVQDESPLEVSLDSFCLWAPCPYDWYEPALLEPSKVSKLSPGCKSSSTSDFFIPTFDPSGDRTNGSDESDEPPDTGGIFARLPKPKPPKFPPQTASQPQVNQVSRNYSETIPKLFHRIVAGSSTQPARSPPSGDASF